MTKTFTFTVWSLDVWGHTHAECEGECPCAERLNHDCECGYEVNDRCKVGEIVIDVEGTTFNAGTPHQFEAWSPTDEQIRGALIDGGFLLPEVPADALHIDGESDYSLTVDRAADGRPLFQLENESEAS